MVDCVGFWAQARRGAIVSIISNIRIAAHSVYDARKETVGFSRREKRQHS
jgi:hypothetical protein